MSSGIFGYAPVGQLNGSNGGPFGSAMGGASQIGPTQPGGSQSDPFANTMGGPSAINMFASPFASHSNSEMPMAQPSRPMGQSQGGQGGQGGGGSQGGSQSGGGGGGSSPLSMIGKVAGMMGGGSQGQRNTSPMGMFGGMKSPADMYGAQQPGQSPQGFMSGLTGGQPNGQIGGTNQFAPASMGDPSQGMNSPTAGMAQNLTQLPTGGLDGGIGNLGSFLGGLF